MTPVQAIVGVVFGHYVIGYELTFLSMIGFVALMGIVVNNSIVMVEFYNVERATGASHARKYACEGDC